MIEKTGSIKYPFSFFNALVKSNRESIKIFMITLQYVTIDAYVKNFSWDLIKNENTSLFPKI